MLPADAAFLHAAEGNLRAVAVGVDEHVSAIKLLSEAMRPAQIARPHVARQPEFRGVGVSDGIFERVVFMDGENRAENLLTRCLHSLVHAREHRGLHEIAGGLPFGLCAVSPAGDAGSVAYRRFDIADDVCEVIGRDERPHIGIFIHGVAYVDSLDALFNLLDERIVDGRREKQAGACETDLALAGEHLAHDAVSGLVEVGILTNDDGALAAKFRKHGRHVRGGESQDFQAALRAAREDDFPDVRVAHNLRARRAPRTRDDVDHPRREPGLFDQFSEIKHRGQGDGGGLDDHRVAAGQGGGQPPGHELERGVPGNDDGHDAQGLSRRIHEPIVHEGLRAALHLARPSGEILEMARGGGGLQAALLDGDARVDGL